MKNSIKLLFCAAALSTLVLTGCQEGPAEKKGKEIDKTVQDIKDKVENKGPAQKAGEKIDDATGH